MPAGPYKKQYPSPVLSEQLMRELGLERDRQEYRALRTEVFRHNTTPPEGSDVDDLARILIAASQQSR